MTVASDDNDGWHDGDGENAYIDLRHVVFDAVVQAWMDGHVAVTNAVLAAVRDNQALVDDYLERLAQAEVK